MFELRCRSLVKGYGARTVLRDVDLTVRSGSVTAVLGSSGSGKTTLLRVIMGFIAADAGTVQIGETLVADGRRSLVAAEQRGIGYVAQEGALFPHLSVGENVSFGLSRDERRGGRRVAEALSLAGLGPQYLARRPGELSGGEQRRVALARALAPKPGVVLLDEPFSGLDATLRSETRDAVVHALREAGATAVLVTHDQSEAMSIGRRIAVLRDGVVIQHGTPVEVYRTPADLALARFVGEAVVLPGRCDGVEVVTELGTLPVLGAPAHGDVSVMIRPEQIRLGPGTGARVIENTFYGPHTTLRLELGGRSASTIFARTPAFDPPAPGDQVSVTVRGPVVVFPIDEPAATVPPIPAPAEATP